MLGLMQAPQPWWETPTAGTVLGILGLVGTVVGIVLAVIFYRRGNKRKEPYWLLETNELVSDYLAQLPGTCIAARPNGGREWST